MVGGRGVGWNTGSNMKQQVEEQEIIAILDWIFKGKFKILDSLRNRLSVKTLILTACDQISLKSDWWYGNPVKTIVVVQMTNNSLN